VTEEGITDEEQILVLAWKSALVNDEIALSFVTLVKILFWVNLEDIVTHLEPYWLDFGGHFFAWLLNMAECLVRFAVKVWKSYGPFLPNLLEYIWWN
jgi:hypothetical protein